MKISFTEESMEEKKRAREIARERERDLESELDEDLLQFLIHEVDAELLEAVVVENLETVNIQHPDLHAVEILFGDGQIHLFHYVVEAFAVHRFGQRVAGELSLLFRRRLHDDFFARADAHLNFTRAH